jgi:hypothetical protein
MGEFSLVSSQAAGTTFKWPAPLSDTARIEFSSSPPM